MKRYITFSGPTYEKYGGANDIMGFSDDIEQAKLYSLITGGCWTNIYDTVECKIVLWRVDNIWMTVEDFENY